MKSDTNLLPESERKFLKTEKLFRTVVFAFILGLIGIAVVAAFFWAMRMIVMTHKTGVQKQLTTLQTQGQESEEGQAEQQIRKLNQIVNDFDGNIKNHPQWTPLVEELLAVTPDGITFREMVGDSEDTTLQISGKSQNRQQLIDFQDILKEAEFTQQLDAPLSNIIERENVPFDLTIKVKKDFIFPGIK